MAGYERTPEHRARMSERRRGWQPTPEQRERLSAAVKAQMADPAHRARISEAVKSSPRAKAAAEARRVWPTRQHYQRARAWASHGLTVEEGEALFAHQGGLCAVCRGDNGGRLLAIDHDHATGRVRGLVCHPCNLAAGHVERLRGRGLMDRMEEYLK